MCFDMERDTLTKPLSVFLLLCLLLTSFVSAAKSDGIGLTEAERAYIAENPIIRVANEMDWPPFDFNAFGKPRGLAIDHIKLLGEKAGLQIEFVNGFTWAELVDQFKNKQIDVIPALYRNESREAFTLFTRPYYAGKLGVFAHEQGSPIDTLDDLIGKRIGIQKAHGAIPLIREKIPGIEFVENPSPETLVTMLGQRKLDAIIGNPLLFSHFAKENQILHLRLIHFVEMTDEEQQKTSLHVGVRKDVPLLHSILTKALRAVTTKEMREIESRWNSVRGTERVVGEDEGKVHRVQLTPEEKVFIENHPTIKVSNELDWPPFDFAVGNEPQGYSIDMLRLLAERSGIQLEFVNGYTWNELWEMFERKELDVVHPVLINDKREEFGLATKRMFGGRQIFITRKDAPDIQAISQLRDKVFATPAGWALTGYLQDNHPEMKLLITKGTIEALDAVSKGLAYATAELDAVAGYLLNKEMRTDLRKNAWFQEFDQRHKYDLHFLVRKDWPLLLQIFNKALSSLTPEEVSGLQVKWFGSQRTVGAAEEKRIFLTPEERAYLSKKGQLTACIDPNWTPYERLGEDGDHEGMSADFFKLFKGRLNISYRLHKTESWSETLEAAREHQCDILTLAAPTKSRREYLDFTTPYLSFPFVIATRTEQFFIEEFEHFLDKTYTVGRDYAVSELLKQKYPDLNLVEVKQVDDGLQMVREGKAFGYIGATAEVAHALQRSGMVDVKVAGRLAWGYELGIASRSDEPLLGVIMQKAVSSLASEEQKRIHSKWMTLNVERVTDHTLLLQVLFGASIILIVVFYWNRQLHRERTITGEALSKLENAQNLLQDQNQKLEKLSVTDHLTQLNNRTKLDQVLVEEFERGERLGQSFGVILIDLDHFKRINDDHGHQVGDLILVEIAKLFSANVRTIDTLGRWGGEEFLIVCPGTSQEGAAIFAEHLRVAVAEHKFPVIGQQTSSFGVAAYQPTDTVSELVSRADKALYKAKENGRNRVEAG